LLILRKDVGGQVKAGARSGLDQDSSISSDSETAIDADAAALLKLQDGAMPVKLLQRSRVNLRPVTFFNDRQGGRMRSG